MAAMQEEQPAAQPGPLSWKNKMKVVLVLLTIPLCVVFWADFAVQVTRHIQEGPARYSVELVGATGISRQALDPDGAAESPVFNLLVHVDNGHTYDMQRDAGGDVVVSYAGVPLARGRAPAWYVETKKAAAVAVDATSGGVGIPEDLLELMAAERLSGVAHQLDVDLWIRYDGYFTCPVQMDGVRRAASTCEKLNLIYSS